MPAPRLPPAPSARRRAWAAVAICAAAYLYAFPYHPQVNNPNENVRFYMTAALAENGTYRIDEIRTRWGWVNDAAVYEGHSFSVKAPGTSLLGVPAYWLYDKWTELRGIRFERTHALWWVRMSASALPTLALLFAMHRWLRDRGVPAMVRDAIVLSLGAGSLLFAYATMFVSHATSAAFAFGAFMLLERARARRRARLGASFAAGVLAAGTTALEYPGFVATSLLCIYALFALRPWHRVLAFAIGAAIPTAAVLHFHDRAFGNPLTPGHRYLEYPQFRELANQGFFGASEFSADAAGGLLFDPAYGLFPLTPILLLAGIGIPILIVRRRTRLDALFALAIPFSTYALICFMNNWRGGWTVGPRYLALALPFLAWFAGEGGRALFRHVPRITGGLAVGATATAFLASGAISAYYPHVPEAFTRPLPQLIRPLVRNDYAPYNAGSWIAEQLGGEWCGSATMVPMLALACFALAWIAWSERRMTDRLIVLILSSFLGSTMMAPLVADDPSATGVASALEYVTRFWDPSGCDRAARLERRIREAHGAASEAEWRALIASYTETGRMQDARSAERRARAAGALSPGDRAQQAPR